MAGPRLFDHDEAVRRRAGGESIAALGREYGVTAGAVYQVVRSSLDPTYREEQNASKKAWRTATCEACGGPAMKLTGTKARAGHDGRVLCISCRGVASRTRLRFDEDGVLISVRCSLVDCANGERWQPPSNFPGGKRFKDIRPKGIHGLCRSCNTRTRKAWRERQVAKPKAAG